MRTIEKKETASLRSAWVVSMTAQQKKYGFISK